MIESPWGLGYLLALLPRGLSITKTHAFQVLLVSRFGMSRLEYTQFRDVLVVYKYYKVSVNYALCTHKHSHFCIGSVDGVVKILFR